MVKAVRFPVAALASIGATLVIGNISAFAYPSGSLGYDIGYPQCGITFPRTSVAAAPSLIGSRGPWWSTPRNIAPTRGSSATSIWYRGYYSFGIIGVDSGYPFLSPAHPGNPCLAAEYARAPNPGLYINTGYDPSYTDSNHTTPDCQTQSGSVSGSPAQKALGGGLQRSAGKLWLRVRQRDHQRGGLVARRRDPKQLVRSAGYRLHRSQPQPVHPPGPYRYLDPHRRRPYRHLPQPPPVVVHRRQSGGDRPDKRLGRHRSAHRARGGYVLCQHLQLFGEPGDIGAVRERLDRPGRRLLDDKLRAHDRAPICPDAAGDRRHGSRPILRACVAASGDAGLDPPSRHPCVDRRARLGPRMVRLERTGSEKACEVGGANDFSVGYLDRRRRPSSGGSFGLARVSADGRAACQYGGSYRNRTTAERVRPRRYRRRPAFQTAATALAFDRERDCALDCDRPLHSHANRYVIA